MSTALSIAKEILPIVSEELWTEAGQLPCVLSVDLKPTKFTVRDLLRLEAGSIVESNNSNGADVPLLVNSQVIGWAEFEVVGQKLAVRITGIS